MTTVIRMGTEGVNPDMWQRGQVWAPPKTFKMLPYDIIGGQPQSVARAVEVLDAMLHVECRKAPVDVYGHSVRAQTICAWLREKGPTSSIEPSDIRFLLGANPEHKYTGRCRASTGYKLYGGNGFPDDTPYTVISMTRQYDSYGDYPHNTHNLIAMSNIGGEITGYGFSVHIGYQDVPFFHPSYASWSEPGHPNLRYLWAPTEPVWYLRPFRSVIESAYSRPVSIPS